MIVWVIIISERKWVHAVTVFKKDRHRCSLGFCKG
jgi:hypothetical protein